MRRLLTVLAGVTILGASVTTSATGAVPLWQASVPFTNVVASTPTLGGGYPIPPGSRVPVAGSCRLGPQL